MCKRRHPPYTSVLESPDQTYLINLMVVRSAQRVNEGGAQDVCIGDGGSRVVVNDGKSNVAALAAALVLQKGTVLHST